MDVRRLFCEKKFEFVLIVVRILDADYKQEISIKIFSKKFSRVAA